MPISNAKPGSPCPMFIAGIRYRSIAAAADQYGADFVGLYKSLNKSNGAPTVYKKQFVVTDVWVRGRIGKTV